MTRLLLGVCVVLMVAILLQTTYAQKGNRKKNPGKRKQCSFKSREQKEFRNNTLPETLMYDFFIEGFPVTTLELVLNPKMNVPEIEIGNERNGFRKADSKRTKKVGIYTDKNGHGSFACEASKGDDWKLNCDLSGLIYFNNEVCYIGGGVQQAECGNATSEGELKILYPPDVARSKRSVATNNTPDLLARHRRSLLPSPGFKVVEVAFALDAAFMDQFYDRHPDNTAAAQAEVEIYMALLVNEMNVFYASVKEASAGALDLYVYPAAVVYPSFGSDFGWSANHKSGTTLRSGTAFDAELRTFFSSGFTTRQHEHAMALTGLDLLADDGSSGLLGYAYVGTVCVSTSYKYSINEFTTYNVAWVASHELGHALGSYHDQTTACPAGKNVMSAYLFNPSASTVDTYSRFSSCSTSQFITHLNSQQFACTANNGFTDEQFQASFCMGLLGQRDNSLNLQCQQRTGYAGSTVCSGTISGDAGCYAYGQVTCRGASGSCSTLGFVWNGTPCGSGRMCFKGRCVANFEICPAVTTAAPTTTESTTAAPTTTESTTAPPTTTETTTEAPTTTETTTEAPTTTETTTEAPTTTETTTEAPTTTETTTEAPTTTEFTTEAPTTTETTTEAPTTTETTTEASTTTETTTEAPTTTETTTEAPTTTETTTEAPTTTETTTAPPTTTETTTAPPTTTETTTAPPITTETTTAPQTTTETTTAPPTTTETTTAAPTTTETTTEAPTTTETTIAPPTTTETTTAPPTTTETTTAPPTTTETTTAPPTTTETTTASPTTTETTTAAPTTTETTTAPPTTTETTTAAPTTTETTTAAPTTAVPTTSAQTTAAPCNCCRRKKIEKCCERKFYRLNQVCTCCPPNTSHFKEEDSSSQDENEQIS